MRNRITATASAFAVAALTVSALATPAGAATAPAAKVGTTSLATVLAADGHHFDHNWNDFDILDKAVTTVLKAKPDSKVAVLTKGNKRVTAFLPTDRAFRKLVRSLTGKAPHTEKATFNKLAKVADVATIEAVLLYHVVPGVTITKAQAAKSDGAKLTTAQGGTIKVNVTRKEVVLGDKDTNSRNARIISFNINKGNKQIAHGVDRVLRPIDL